MTHLKLISLELLAFWVDFFLCITISFSLVSVTSPSFLKMLKRENLERILESLRDPMALKIGIYGMGGSGKTSTMMEITHWLRTRGDFDAIIWVTVSENLDLYKVQDQIARDLDLDLPKHVDQVGRAGLLFQRLNRPNKKFLLVLDDVWESIPLEKVGIPTKECKIVVATRSLAVCHRMETHKNIKIELFSDEEAWLFFIKVAGYQFRVPDLQPLVGEVVRECAGLGMAIDTIGKIWRNNTRSTVLWSRILMDPKTSLAKGMEPVISVLRFSYRRLNNDILRKCFLHLAFFPEGYQVEANELVWYWMGNLGMKTDEGFMILNELVDAGLLDKCSDLETDHIKMHKLIRTMAIGILEEEGRMLIEPGLGLTEPPKRNDWKKLRRISWIKNVIELLPDPPNCPNLSSLFLRENPLSQNISSSFFDQMPALEILDLSYTSISELPSSLSNLLKLQALFLQECNSLEKIPSLAKLKKLRILNLSRTGIKELPQGMEELISLCSLDLSYTLDLEMKSITVDEDSEISSTRLRIDDLSDQPSWSNILNLSLRGNHLLQKISSSFFDHTPDLEILDLSQTSITELPSSLSDLPNLCTLCLQECTFLVKLPSFAKLNKLRKLNLSHTAIEKLPQGMDTLISLKSLDISFTYQLESCMVSELSLLEELQMEGCKISMDSISLFKCIEEMRHFGRLALLTLSFVRLEDYLKSFICLQWEKLQNFSIRISDTLDLFVSYHTETSSRFVHMDNQKIFSYLSTLILPPNTQELRLSLCDVPRLSELFFLGGLRFLNKCHFERCSLMSGDCLILGDEMEENMLESLHNLSLENVRGLGVLWKGVVSNPVLKNLRVLELRRCGGLKNLFCFNFLDHLKNIEVIEVTLCGLLEEIVSEVQGPCEIGRRIILPRLHTLILKDLPKLHTISRMMWVCVSLRHFEVFRCLKLKKLPFDLDNLPNLENPRGEMEWLEALEWDNAYTRNVLRSRVQ